MWIILKINVIDLACCFERHGSFIAGTMYVLYIADCNTLSQKLKVFLQLCYCFIGEVENAEERTERAKACPCPVHARRGRKIPKDRLRVQFL